MYLGRIVAVGMNQQGQPVAMYRVSSRSFPNRQAVLLDGKAAIMPRPGFESDLQKNPYITYNCVRTAGNYALVSNGSQTDPIIEKIASGMSVRDAISLGLLAMDYEKDSLDTPRIVAVIDKKNPSCAYLGIIRKDALLVREMKLSKGMAFYLSTYEKNRPCDCNVDEHFDVSCAACACDYVINGGVFADFENPVTAACVIAQDDSFALAVKTI